MALWIPLPCPSHAMEESLASTALRQGTAPEVFRKITSLELGWVLREGKLRHGASPSTGQRAGCCKTTPGPGSRSGEAAEGGGTETRLRLGFSSLLSSFS